MRDSLDPDPLRHTNYRALRVLGAGAMGIVVEAEHLELRRVVCVKLLKEELAAEPSVRERFRIEAQALALLGAGRHPNLVHVSDAGVTPAGRPFLVMERLEGGTLQDLRKARGGLPWDWREVVDVGLQVLAGLAVAHAEGVVHRDIKPANLFVCGAGDERVVKILDFGIAKVVEAAARAESKRPIAPSAQPTAAGLLVGSPRYTSPEQIGGGSIRAQTDLYSLGAVLWELLTGKPPWFDRRSLEDILTAQVLDPHPRVSMFVPNVPPPLEALIASALSKAPEARPASADAMASAMRALLVDEVSAPSPRRVHDTVPLEMFATLIADPEPDTTTAAAPAASGADRTEIAMARRELNRGRRGWGPFFLVLGVATLVLIAVGYLLLHLDR